MKLEMQCGETVRLRASLWNRRCVRVKCRKEGDYAPCSGQ